MADIEKALWELADILPTYEELAHNYVKLADLLEHNPSLTVTPGVRIVHSGTDWHIAAGSSRLSEVAKKAIALNSFDTAIDAIHAAWEQIDE